MPQNGLESTDLLSSRSRFSDSNVAMMSLVGIPAPHEKELSDGLNFRWLSRGGGFLSDDDKLDFSAFLAAVVRFLHLSPAFSCIYIGAVTTIYRWLGVHHFFVLQTSCL